MKFSTGRYGALRCVDLSQWQKELQESASTNTKSLKECPQLDELNEIDSTPSNIDISPDGKVVVLDAWSLLPGGSTDFGDSVERQFMGYGWDERNVLKYNSQDTSGGIGIPPNTLQRGAPDSGVLVLLTDTFYGKPWEVSGGQTPPADVPEAGDYTYMLCGNDADFTPALGEGQQQWFQQWYDEGKLVSVPMNDPDTGTDVMATYMRSDLLDEMLPDLEGATVYVAGPDGWKLKDTFVDNGCGNFFAWDGPPPGGATTDGLALKRVFDAMAGSGSTAAMSGADAHDSLGDNAKHASYPWYGVTDTVIDTFLQHYTPDNTAAYLPTWVTLGKVTSYPEAETMTVDVFYTDPALADAARSYELDASGAILTELVPGDAVFTIKALDKDRNYIDMGLTQNKLNGGSNSVTPFFGKGSLDLYIADGYLPGDGELVNKVEYSVVYSDDSSTTLGPFEAPPGEDGKFRYEVSEEVPIGKGKVYATAYDAEENVVGNTAVDHYFESVYNIPRMEFGWAKLSSDDYPEGTARIVCRDRGPRRPCDQSRPGGIPPR